MVAALINLLGRPRGFADVARLRSELEARMIDAHPGAFVLGAKVERLPNTVNICLPGIDAEDLVDRMAAADIAISAGSACSYGARKPSYVILAHGLNYDEAKSCVRVSLSVESTGQDADRFLHVLMDLLAASAMTSGRKLERA
jgi:cysteine desulfurase